MEIPVVDTDNKTRQNYKNQIMWFVKHDVNDEDIEKLIEFERKLIQLNNGHKTQNILTIKQLQKLGNWVINHLLFFN